MFYKYENEELISGPHVMFPNGVMLHVDLLSQLSLPYEGWHYFATEEEAKAFFNIE